MRSFNEAGINHLDKSHSSLSLLSDYYVEWNGGDNSFTFTPFFRFDQRDQQRSHFDLRELTWVRVRGNWELRAGVRKVFWGVTESQHLVDIINQTDYVENPDGEEKLGQPMINLSYSGNLGIVDLYLLTGFRERTYPGEDGRLGTPFPIKESEARFESGAGRNRSDFAVRWSHYIGDWEMGLSHFSGTTREPTFELQMAVDPTGLPVDASLIPMYDVIEQTGLDLQFIGEDWLWKLELIRRAGQGDPFTAATFGFEKTLVGLLNSRADVGLVVEYLFDDRGEQAPVYGENDWAVGLRWALNDVDDSQLLVVFVWDEKTAEQLVSLEASRRLGENWKLIAEATVFGNGTRLTDDLNSRLRQLTDPTNKLGYLQEEDFLKLELVRYF